MMLKRAFVIPNTFIILMALFTFSACEQDDPTTGEGSGRVSIEMTDAPIDDAQVQGVFVTVAEVKVDGQTIEGFQPKTIDIKAYQQGSVVLLTDSEVDAKAYSSISLVLDHATDASGNSPGCYVLTTDGTKDKLQVGANDRSELTLTGNNFEVEENQTTNLVVDFDLRKSVRRDGADEYEFVAGNDLAAALRVVTREETGTVAGQASAWEAHADKAIVYAYRKGTFNANAETSGEVQFKNAVTSAELSNNGSYELHFLEAGEYDLYFAGYEDNDQDGKFELKGSLTVDLLGAVNLNTVTVDAKSTTRFDLTVVGILPL